MSAKIKVINGNDCGTQTKKHVVIDVSCQQHSDFQEDGVLKKKERGFMFALRHDADFADYR